MTDLYECEDKMVSHPAHYKGSKGLEVLEVIENFVTFLDGVEAYCTGNLIKYVCRWKAKNGIQDLRKVIYYATYLINYEERKYEEKEFTLEEKLAYTD